MSKNAPDSMRARNKIQAAIDRMEKFGVDFPLCDYCQKNEGVELHERLTRAMTVGNMDARELSYQVELTNLLCRSCHQKASEEEVDRALWQFSISLYGFERVYNAFEQFKSTMRTRIRIPELE